MMGASHGLSGVAGWTGLCAAASLAGYEPAWSTVVVGAGVSAGFALLPDLDHPGSTISTALGPLTRAVSRVVSFVADLVQDASCRCCKDPDTTAHRGLTHTFVGAVLLAALIALAGWRLGKPAAVVVVFVGVGLAVRGMVSRRSRGTLGAAVAGVVAAGLLYVLGPVGGWWWLGVPAGFGVLAHIAGDGITKTSVPLLFPLKIRGCRWFPCGPPYWLRFRTGGGVERWVVGPLMLAALAGSAWVLVS